MADYDLMELDSTEEMFPGVGKYEGERNEKGERHGEGQAIYYNGDKYQGNFENGKRHGLGTYTFNQLRCNGSYTGEYFEGQRHGQGVFLYPNGESYNGNWVNDCKSGQGTYTYSNGDVYRGSWENDKRHGKGEYTYKDKDMMYRGNWDEGQMSGKGKLITSNYRFIGMFDEGKPIGGGRFLFNKGCTQNGHYYEKRLVTYNKANNQRVVSHIPQWKCHAMYYSQPF